MTTVVFGGNEHKGIELPLPFKTRTQLVEHLSWGQNSLPLRMIRQGIYFLGH